LVPQLYLFGSGSVLPVLPTILMSAAAGLVGYANGAVVPAEPAAVVAARADHLAALSAAY